MRTLRNPKKTVFSGMKVFGSFIISRFIPSRPTISSPADASSSTDTTPTFDWNDVPGALTYKIQIASDAGFTTVVQHSDAVAVSTYTATALAIGDYFVRVRSQNGSGNSAYSTTVSFTITA